MRLEPIILGLAIPVLAAYGQQPVVSSRGNSTAAGRIATTAQRGPAASPDSEVSAWSPLIGTTADQLRNEYSADNQSCAVPFRPYVALRLAEKKYHFDRESVLRQMCARRTASFAFALQSAGGVYGTLTESGPKQNQELREAEREFLRQLDQALKGQTRHQ
jgi:hypothetical protein